MQCVIVLVVVVAVAVCGGSGGGYIECALYVLMNEYIICEVS